MILITTMLRHFDRLNDHKLSNHQIISHEKYDAKKTYKKNTGYFPGVATIGDKVIHIENRDGNANVKTGQAETLERAYKSVEAHGMTINRSRTVIELVEIWMRAVIQKKLYRSYPGTASYFTSAPTGA